MAGVSGLINVRARQRPDEPAFITGTDGQTLTWLGLARFADRVRRLADERRLPVQARIGLVLTDPLAFTAGYLGALGGGLTAVPIDPRLTSTELVWGVEPTTRAWIIRDRGAVRGTVPTVQTPVVLLYSRLGLAETNMSPAGSRS